VELDAKCAATNLLRSEANLAYVDATFTDYPDV
jgi:hypothetical protein